MGGKRTKTRKTTVKESYALLINDESDKLLDQDEVVQRRRSNRPRTTASSSSTRSTRSPSREGGMGAGVSREGVQRDLLPLVEGTTVATKYGPVKTDHVLFIASGAFHVAKPSDLLAGTAGPPADPRRAARAGEGRFPPHPDRDRGQPDQAVHRADGDRRRDADFTDDAIDSLAGIAVDLNASVENIGARRLQTVMERVLDEISFNAPDRAGTEVTIDAAYVEKHVGDLARNTDLSRFIL